MTYDTQVDDKDYFEILRRLKAVGEESQVFTVREQRYDERFQAEAKAGGRMGVESHPATRSGCRWRQRPLTGCCRLAEVVDIPVIVVHLTCQGGI